MINPQGQTTKLWLGSLKTDHKQKKQNTQKMSICKPEQIIRITTWHAFQIFWRKENGNRNS